MPTPHELYDEADRLKDGGKFAEAAEKLGEVLKLDDKFALAHSALAVVLGKLGRHEEAIEHAQQVCQLEPEEPFSYTALSVTCQRAFAGTGNHAYIHQAEEAMARSRMIQGGY
jgi:tetratricopeptide (TPR) repeat protein